MLTPPIVAVPDMVSLPVKTVEVLFEPLFVYSTKRVLGSVPSVADVSITFAFTPEVAPVNTIPFKSDKVLVPVNEVSLTELLMST